MDSKEIKRDSSKTLYKQVQEYILNKINEGIYKLGEAIPTERELSQKLSVSRYTIRRAIQDLVHEGCLYRVQGSGTFVYDNKKTTENYGNIGVILTHCEHELEANILSGIESFIQKKGFNMSFVSSNDNYKIEAESIHTMRLNGIEGLIIMPAEDQKESNAITDLKNEEFPFVLVDRGLQDCKTNCVMSDNILGGYKATEYLIELGHKEIGFIKGKFSKTSSIEDRIIGYKSALKDYGLLGKDNKIFSYDNNLEKKEMYNNIYDYIKESGITSLLAINDYIALDVIKMSRGKDIEIPADLSLIGFDNLDFSSHLEIPLTTIAQSSKEIGEEAARILIDKINEKDNDIIVQKYFPVKLIERESCSRY